MVAAAVSDRSAHEVPAPDGPALEERSWTSTQRVGPESSVVVVAFFPFPTMSGGQKRAVRLIEAMERAGATPHLISGEIPSAEGAAQCRDRGWSWEATGPPPRGLRPRLQQHIRRLPAPHSAEMAAAIARTASLAPAFFQFEEGHTLQYARAVPRAVPRVISTYNADSQVAWTLASRARPVSVSRARAVSQASRRRSAERSACRHSDAVLCVSSNDAEHFAHLGGHALLVPNGVDDDLFDIESTLADSQGVLFFGTLGYAFNEEGVIRFLREGWPIIAERRPAARLRLAGAGASAGLREAVAQSQNVDLIGFVPDLKIELARARLVVVPIWSGGGTRLKALEALAAARPLVGTPLGLEQIGFKDGRDGLVAETPEGLAQAALRMLDDPALSGALADRGRSLAREFRWEAVTRPALDLYRRWLSRSR